MGKVNGILTSRTGPVHSIQVCGGFYGVLLGLMITVKHQLLKQINLPIYQLCYVTFHT